VSDLPFSPDALREKYRIEREKRLRAEGSNQYHALADHFAEDDPFTQRRERAACEESVDVAIVGGGFGGMLAAIALRQAGVHRFRIVEKAGDFGGTWYWNRYPGARCDVESYIYLPLLEETGYVPTERYATAPEIFAYCQQLGRQFDLYESALFHTEVEDLRWDDTDNHWVMTTDRGDCIISRFAIVAGGVLHKAKLPGIEGIESFAGHSFHTSRWDYAYTGGSPAAGMDRLADKRVGIIGTGATALQAIPHLAESAQHLYVFQRTPSGVGVRGNGPTDREWFASLKPGWQQERLDNFTFLTGGGYDGTVLVRDGWTQVFVSQSEAALQDPANAAALRELADFRNMEEVRARASAVVKDPRTAEALKPYYNQMCKRPCFHDEYLETFNRDNVTLVDTDGRGVERITPSGAVAGGVEYALDCLIYASGFEVSTDYTRRLGFEIRGHRGLTMTERMAEGATTLFGVHRRDFPNLLLFASAQCAAPINYVHVLIELSRHSAYVIQRALAAGVDKVEPSAEASEAWFATIRSRLQAAGSFQSECTPGNFNNEGNPGELVERNAVFLGNALDYFAILREWREAGDMQGLILESRADELRHSAG
jgi:cation diffusion facilitator CzcD-associated flavoprotein CzcO